MPGTRLGGKRAAATTKEIHGDDFYKRIGALGGKAPTNGLKGFAANPDLARIAGAKGGRMSKRRRRNESENERQKRQRDARNAVSI